MTDDPKRLAVERGRFLEAMMRDVALTPTQRLVGYHLLAHVNRTTGNAWPSVDTIARLAGLQRRATQQAIRGLVAARWFRETPGGGRHRPNTYRPNQETVHQNARYGAEETVQSSAPYQAGETAQQNAPNVRKRVQSDARKGAFSYQKGCIPRQETVQQNAPDLTDDLSYDLTEEPIDAKQPIQQQPLPASQNSPKRATRMASDWVLPAAWAHEGNQVRERAGLEPINVNHEAERFRDYWLAQPGAKGLKSDWRATWRNWCRSARVPLQQPAAGRATRGDVVATARRFAAHLDAEEAA